MALTVTGVSPRDGSPFGGDLVTISGSGLSGVKSAVFGSRPAGMVTVVSDQTVTVVSPPGTGSVGVSVVDVGGATTAAGTFGYGELAVEVLRPDDLMVLRLAFPNGVVGDGPPLRVVRSSPDVPLIVVVQFPPQHIAESAYPAGQQIPAPSVPAVMSQPSRLAFRVQAPAVTLRVDALLDWTGWALLQPAKAGLPPQPLESALELPYRLVVSPPNGVSWRHATAPALLEGTAEVWHTELDPTTGPQNLSIWWSDLSAGTAPKPNVTAPLNPTDRAALARSGAGRVERLTLSALGCWADLNAAPGLVDPASSLIEWRQVIGQGRDQYVRVVHRSHGHLAAFGHRAAIVDVTERAPMRAADGTATEALVTTTFLVPMQPLVEFTDLQAAGFDHQGRELPFTAVRLAATASPALDGPLSDTDPQVPMVGGAPLQLHYVAIDHAGREVDLVMPVLFVPEHADSTKVAAAYAAARLAPATVGGQPVTYLPAGPDGADAAAATMVTNAMAFQLQKRVSGDPLVAPFLPAMRVAAVGIPAVEQLLSSAGGSGQVTFQFHPDYLDGRAKNVGQVFGQLVAGLNDTSPTILGFGMTADRGGGLATPHLPLDGLSSAYGPVAGSAGLVAGSFDPKHVLAGLGCRLLGSIDLADILATVELTPRFDTTHLPTLQQRRNPDSVETLFDWNPPVSSSTEVLEVSTTTRLHLLSRTVTPLGDPSAATFTVDGTLTNFGLSFFGAVRVDFDTLSFHAERGRKVDLSTGKDLQISFTGPLAFVNELASLLPPAGFNDPPFLTVTPAGISAGYTLSIPSAGAGVLSLENIAISAALDLPFTAPAGLRIAFAERYHKFLVTVSLIGGGGFLAVEVDAAGINRVEGALELGGNLTVDLLVVSANVHVLAGFYFVLSKQQLPDGRQVTRPDFSGYLRIGGSVNLLGIVSVSVELMLQLDYDSRDNPTQIRGSASVTVSVHVLFVNKSFTLSVEKHFPLPGFGAAHAALAPAPTPATFGALLSRPEWAAYCESFS